MGIAPTHSLRISSKVTQKLHAMARIVAKDLLKTMDNSTVMQEALGEAQEALQHTCHSP